jgi:hypothetical protein
MQIVPTAQSVLKFDGVLPATMVDNRGVWLAKLVCHQAGVCTPTKLSPGGAIGRRHICGRYIAVLQW